MSEIRGSIFSTIHSFSRELLWLESKTLFREYYCNQTESVTGTRILKAHLKRGDLSFDPILNCTWPQICCAPSGTYGSRIYVFIFRYIIITNYGWFCNYSDFWLKVVLNIYIFLKWIWLTIMGCYSRKKKERVLHLITSWNFLSCSKCVSEHNG